MRYGFDYGSLKTNKIQKKKKKRIGREKTGQSTARQTRRDGLMLLLTQ